MKNINGMLTIKEAAAKIGVVHSTVSRWIAAGKLPAIRVGGTYRIRHEDLENMVQPV